MSALKVFALRWLTIFIGLLAVAVAVLGFGMAIGSVFAEGDPSVRVGGFVAGLVLASLGVAALLWVNE